MTLSPAIVEALSISELPDVQWKIHDDLCDCTYQRIGQWTNPYLAETLEVRMCCIWNEIYKQYPEFVRTIPAYWSDNDQEWVTEPAAWNGEDDMPESMWVRQLSRAVGVSLTEARAMAIEPPKGTPRQPKPKFLLPWSGQYIEVELG